MDLTQGQATQRYRGLEWIKEARKMRQGQGLKGHGQHKLRGDVSQEEEAATGRRLNGPGLCKGIPGDL